MKEQRQTITHPDTGNCFRACLASLLEIDINKIPPFETMMGNNKWFYVFVVWINNMNYDFFGYISTTQTDDIKRLLLEFEGVDGYTIVQGDEAYPDFDYDHVVIYKNGKFHFDPHPRPGDLKNITGFYAIRKYQ
jgi:hypothetical protein